MRRTRLLSRFFVPNCEAASGGDFLLGKTVTPSKNYGIIGQD